MEFTPENLARFERIAARYPVRRSALLPALHIAQQQQGYLTPEAIEYVAELFQLTPAQVHDTATYYTMFAFEPRGETHIEVCTNLSCALRGADALLDRACSKLGIEPGGTSPDGRFSVERVECLAACGGAPAVQVNGEWLEGATAEDIDAILGGGKAPYRPFDWPKSPGPPVLLRNAFKDDSQAIETYRAGGGYAKLAEHLKMTPDAIIGELKKATLRGRGGAGFPTGLKWSFLPKDSPKPRYLCVNADESEPGTYKDRLIIEQDPHQLVEASIVSSHAIRAEKCFIYIRGEFHEGIRTLQKAVDEAYAAGLLGSDILGSGVNVEITVHGGAGAYECGEETALLESLEGKRGQPRLKPPFPANVGLYGCPTIVNNVETIACVPLILERGADWFATYGTERNGGPKLYCISGHVEKPGVYELPMGRVTLRELIEVHAGGVRDGHALRAVVQGGSSTPVLTAPGAHGGRDRRRDGLRLARQGRQHARLGRHDRDGRLDLHGVDGAAAELLLQARVVRQVLAVPRGHGLDAPPAAEDRGGRGDRARPRCALERDGRHRRQDALPLRGRRHRPTAVDAQEIPRRVRVPRAGEAVLAQGRSNLRRSARQKERDGGGMT